MAGHHHGEDLRVSSRKLTYEDFCLFPDDGQRHELIDGEHYVTPSPTIRHQLLSRRLTDAILRYQREHPGGELFYAPLDCVFTDFDIVEPDLLFVTDDQRHILTEEHVCGAPALVVEILSPGTRRVDQRTKLALYDRVGVREYWLVDPSADTVTVHRRTGDGHLSTEGTLDVARHGLLTTPLLPGFALPLAEYFSRI